MNNKQKIIVIASIDNNYGIGKNGDLIIRNKTDMKLFSTFTTGHACIMGRKTYESLNLPDGLPNRKNIVITHGNIENENIVTAHSFNEALKLAPQNETVFVIGGSSVYEEAITKGLADEVYLSKFDCVADADTFFPNMGEYSYSSLCCDDLCHGKGPGDCKQIKDFPYADMYIEWWYEKASIIDIDPITDSKFSFTIYKRVDKVYTVNRVDSQRPCDSSNTFGLQTEN